MRRANPCTGQWACALLQGSRSSAPTSFDYSGDVEEVGEADEAGEASDQVHLGSTELETTALGCVLEEAVDQLCILAYTSRAAELAPQKAKKSLDER